MDILSKLMNKNLGNNMPNSLGRINISIQSWRLHRSSTKPNAQVRSILSRNEHLLELGQIISVQLSTCGFEPDLAQDAFVTRFVPVA